MPRFFRVCILLAVLCLACLLHLEMAQGRDIKEEEALWDAIHQSYNDFSEGKADPESTQALLTQGLVHPYFGNSHKTLFFTMRSSVNLFLGYPNLARDDAKMSLVLAPESPVASFIGLLVVENFEGNYEAARAYLVQAWEHTPTREEAKQLTMLKNYIELAHDPLDVEDFFAQYQAQPAALDAQSAKKGIAVRGRVSRMDQTPEGTPLLIFALSNGEEVRCEILTTFHYLAERLKMGEEVVILGFIKSRDDKAIVLKNSGFLSCFLPAPAPSVAGKVLWDEIVQAYEEFETGSVGGETLLALVNQGVGSTLLDLSRKGESFLYRGSVHALMGKLDLARSDVNMGLALNPDLSTEAWAVLAAVECASGNYELAHDHIAKGREQAFTPKQIQRLDKVEERLLLAENALEAYRAFMQYLNAPQVIREKYPAGLPVRGRISRMEQTAGGLWEVHLMADESRVIRCEMDRLSSDITARLKRRDTVVIWGTIKSGAGGRLVLEKCTILSWPS